MARATRKGYKRKKEKAIDVSRIFSFYVNPDPHPYSEHADLQRQAFPILEQWHEDGDLKEFVLRAVCYFADAFPDSGLSAKEQYIIDQAALIAEHLVPHLKRLQPQVYLNPAAQAAVYLPPPDNPLDNDENDFLEQHLLYND